MSVVGFDIGGVIRERRNITDPEPKVFIPGAVEAIQQLVSRVGAKNTVIISRQDHALWKHTSQWLHDHDFFKNTGFLWQNVHFCLRRPEKANLATRFGVTHFVDNRTEVFEHMPRSVSQRFLFRPRSEELQSPRKVGALHVVWTWPEALTRIVSTL